MLNVLSINNCMPHLVRCGILVADYFAVDTLAQGVRASEQFYCKAGVSATVYSGLYCTPSAPNTLSYSTTLHA